MRTQDLTKEILHDLYMVQKMSPEKIGQMVGCGGRNIRAIMARLDIPRLNNAHFRTGVSATWNIGLKQSDEAKEKNRQAHLGRSPHNKGQGSRTFNCEVCGKEVFEKPYRKRRVCSNQCRTTLMSILRGETNWNYDPEKPETTQRKRHWAEHREWREKVLERDGHRCRKCGKKANRIAAHHLDSWAEYPDKRSSVDNGVTLCPTCHKAFHAAFSHSQTNRENFEKWLTM